MTAECEIVPFQPTDLESFPELLSVLKAEGAPAITGPAYTARKGDTILAIAGIVPKGGHTGEAWFQSKHPLNGDARWLVWAVRRMLNHLIVEHGFRRVQAIINPSNPNAIRFIRALGFTCETPSHMEAYWHGEARDLYARVTHGT